MKRNRILKILSCITMVVALTAATFLNAYAGYMIDVSSNNGTINWDSVGKQIDGTIIRIGYGNDDTSQDDSQAIRNMDECERLGIPYGVYIYSYALTYEDAQSEIQHTLRMIQGRKPTLGVWYDMEDADGYKSRHGVNVYEQGNMLTDFCTMFVSSMYNAGYKTGVYANYNYFKNVLNSDRLYATKGFNKWLAIWGVDSPPSECSIWQFGAYTIDNYEYDGDIYYDSYTTPIQPSDSVDYSQIYDNQINDTVNTFYQVQINGNRWLPVVTNDSDYAGLDGNSITGVAVSVDKGYAEYRVHDRYGWHGYINSNSTNTGDYDNGYAGTDSPIDAIEVRYYTPDSISNDGYQYAIYYVGTGGGYYSPQYDDEKTDGQDGYAGSFGNSIYRLVLTVNYK